MEGKKMKTLMLGVASRQETNRRFVRAMEVGAPQGDFISFESPAMLWKLLTPKRWDILKAMTGAGPLSIREVARRVGRDVKAVHGDVQALLGCGILAKTVAGLIVFPYDKVRVDFMLEAA
jgi:predicted transcriptional regulator